MTEEAVKNLKFGECVTDGNGNKYTRTIGGWIYSTFAGNACFIPEPAETEVAEMNLNEASQWAFEISKKRNQYKGDGNDTIRALKHCACEVVEAVDAYDNWSMLDNPQGRKEEFENELADVIICVLSVSGSEGIDIEQAISRKMFINEGRAKNDSKE